MATANCTVNGINYFTSSNTSGVWGSTSWFSPTAAINNKPCFGKFYYGGQYKYRALVLKITTPSYPTNSHTRALAISVGLRRSTQGSDNWHCAISTTAPSFSNRTSAQIPNNWVTTWPGISTNGTYATKSFGTGNFNFKSNTTYYLWMYSDTPTGNSTTGFFSNNYGSAPTITVKTTYSTNTSNTNYCLPTNPNLYGHKGYYHGANIEIDENTSYPRCFVGTSATGTFYHKSLKTSTEGRQYFAVDPDTSATSKTYYIIRTTEAYYNQLKTEQGTTPRLTAPPTAYQITYKCPRYACLIYCHSLEPYLCHNLGGATLPSFDGMTAQGLSTTETGTTVDLNYTWSNGVQLNGGTFYRIYTGTKSVTYYCGGPTSHTVSTSITFYGKDSTLSVTSGSIGDTSCETDNTYSLAGWTEVTDSHHVDYEDLDSATADGTVIYGIYDKYEEMEYNPNNGEPPDVAPIFNYVYGTGTKSHYYPEEPSLTKINWEQDYWKNSDSNGTWEALWDEGIRTVDSVWTPDNTINIGNASEWRETKTYYGLNGEWIPIVIRFGANDDWKGGSLIYFAVGPTVFTAKKNMTWGEWCNSKYNVGKFIALDDGIYTRDYHRKVIINASGDIVYPDYTIADSELYYGFIDVDPEANANLGGGHGDKANN